MEILKKKTVLIHTDFAKAYTGFGRNAKLILEYLYKTGKYELVNLAMGSVVGNPELNSTPWKTIGTIQPQKIDAIRNQNDPKNWDNIARMAGYGAFAIDDAINEVKPSVAIFCQDIWGVDYVLERNWYDKIACAIWTTLDSRPILEKGIIAAKKAKNFWSWADFATKDLHKLGLTHVKTIPGAIDSSQFYKLSKKNKLQLKEKLGIDPDTFIIGFVFRNQLRKSVPNAIQGFKLFKRDNPSVKAKLLFHTHWNEGWNIKKLCEEHNIPLTDILTTYICRDCKQYEVKSFAGHDVNCKYCGAVGKPGAQNVAPSGQTTTGPGCGVTEEQLNEVYNLMSVYLHPFTSGGLEYPCYESKLCELVTLITNYSCGEDLCAEEAASIPLEWAEYREPDSMFIKASTYPSSIAKQLTKVLKMDVKTKEQMGKKARQWVIDGFSIEVIGKFLEDFIDAAPLIEDQTIFENKVNPDPYHTMPEIVDDSEWILYLYHNILDRKTVDKNDDGYKHWMARIHKEISRPQIEEYFRQVAFKTIQDQKGGVKFEDFLNKEDKGRVIIVIPESSEDVYLATSLFESIKSKYPDWALYVATKPLFKDILQGNPYIDKWIEYNPIMDNPLWLEGRAESKGYFDVAYLPTQKVPSYLHNQKDKIDFNLK